MSLVLYKLGVRYGARQALTDIGLQVQAGQMLGIVGPNGCGKSTLIKAIAGLIPSSGDILFRGSRLRPPLLGYMPQDNMAPKALTVMEVVLLGRIGQLRLRVGREDLQAVAHVLQRFGIEHLASAQLSELSGGQRQLVFLAQAMVGGPQYLLLDEPTSALDICHQLEVMDQVRQVTRQELLTTVMVLHDLNAAIRYCDQVALLHNGALVQHGPPRTILGAPTVAKVFGVSSETLLCQDGTPVLAPTGKYQQVPPLV